jgi:hypothetical protein
MGLLCAKSAKEQKCNKHRRTSRKKVQKGEREKVFFALVSTSTDQQNLIWNPSGMKTEEMNLKNDYFGHVRCISLREKNFIY